MTAMTSDVEPPTPSIEVPGVLGRLETTRLQIKQSRTWTGLVTFVLGALGVFAAFMLADWIWILPVAARGLVVPALVALAVYLLVRTFRPYDRAAAATDVEGRFPTLGQRIRTLIQYHGPAARSMPASPGLLRALGQDTDERTAALDFGKIVPWGRFERRAVALFFVLVGGLLTLFLAPSLRTAFLRMMFVPAHYTTLKVEPGDLILKAGEELKIQVTLSGRPVPTARWQYRQSSGNGQWTSESLAGNADAARKSRPLIGTVTTSLKDCQNDLDYRVVAGEVESPVYHVHVLHPLLLTGVEARVTPPAYTRRKPELIKQGNLKVIEGSSVDVQIALNHAPKSAELLLGPPGETPVQVPLIKIGDARLSGRLPAIAKETEYQVSAVDDQGMKLEIDPFHIKVTLDQKPTLRFVRPDESLAVTPTTEVPIEVEAGDDFGVSRVGITYKIGGGPEETLHLADLKDQPVTATALAMLYLEKHPIAYPDEISYFAFALDNYPPEPHRVVSEMRFIDILPYKQEYQFVEGEGEPMSGGSLSLEELIARQRVNLSRTFVLEGDRTINEKAAMRLATFEEELATATTEFSDGLKARGINLPALDEAASAMRSATDELDSKQLKPARSHEEAALKSLISVRQNLRKLLSLSQGQMASAGRAFDRQQVQRIRRPPQDKKEQLEAELMELAKREEEFSEEIEAKGGGGVHVDPPPDSQQPAEMPDDPSQDSDSKDSSSSSKSKSESKDAQSKMSPAEQQEKAAADAERLRQMAQRDKSLTELAKDRLDAAAKMVQESKEAMDAGKAAEAAAKARDAARKLESAAHQVGALKAKELADALARERDIAQAIARAERELGKSLDPGADSKQGDKGSESKDDKPEGKSGPAESKEKGSAGKDGRGKSQEAQSSKQSGRSRSRQAGTGKGGSLAGRQRELADEVKALADVLDRLQSEAALDYRELAQTIDRAARQNPPEDVEAAMRQNAEAIEAGRNAQASRDAEQAAQRLEALAQDLESVRRSAVQPQLEQLLAAEKQAAALQERLRTMRQKSQLAEIEKGMTELADLVDKLSPGQSSLHQASQSLTSAVRGAHTGVLNRIDMVVDDASGYFIPPTGYSDGLLAVTLALQAKIQEIILDSALAERDGRVPPRYKEMVEDYYRVLSQDLR